MGRRSAEPARLSGRHRRARHRPRAGARIARGAQLGRALWPVLMLEAWLERKAARAVIGSSRSNLAVAPAKAGVQGICTSLAPGSPLSRGRRDQWIQFELIML